MPALATYAKQNFKTRKNEKGSEFFRRLPTQMPGCIIENESQRVYNFSTNFFLISSMTRKWKIFY